MAGRASGDRCGGCDDQVGAPFGPEWIAEFAAIVAGVRLEPGAGHRRRVQFACVDAARVRPWWIDVDDGVVTDVVAAADRRAQVAVTHSVTVGWRLLGLSVRGHHRIDELTVEQLVGGRWRRFPIPPLDERSIDLGPRPASARSLVWNERVLDSPLGTLYVQHLVRRSGITVVHASTHPSVWPDTHGPAVDSDVAWSALLRGRSSPVEPSRAWRGRTDDVARVQRARRIASWSGHEAAAARDGALRDATALLSGLRRALRSDPRWRELWCPSVPSNRS